MYKKLENGRSMIEMLGVLAIIGVLSVGGIAGYSKAMEQFKINRLINQVSQIVSNTQTLYAQQSNYNGLDGDIAITAGISPTDLGTSVSVSDSLAWKNHFSLPWTNSYIEIKQVRNVENSKLFMITIHGQLPKTTCTALATQNWGTSSTGLVSVTVNGPDVSPQWDGNIYDHTPYNSYFDKCDGLKKSDHIIACPSGHVLSTPVPVSLAAQLCKDCSTGWNYGCGISLVFQ